MFHVPVHSEINLCFIFADSGNQYIQSLFGNRLSFINPKDINTFHPLNVKAALLPEPSEIDRGSFDPVRDLLGLNFKHLKGMSSDQIHHEGLDRFDNGVLNFPATYDTNVGCLAEIENETAKGL